MNWKNRKVLVTGAGGFIGSHLVARLVKLGAQVRALVRYNSRNDWGLPELLPAAVKDRAIRGNTVHLSGSFLRNWWAVPTLHFLVFLSC